MEYEGVRAGTAKEGKGPTGTERQRISHYREIEGAKKLSEEMFTDGRIIVEESSYRPPSAARKPNKKTASRQTDTQRGARAEPVPTPARPNPQVGAFVIGLLQHQHASLCSSLLQLWLRIKT